MTEKELQLYIDYKEVFNSEHGQRVLADLQKVFRFNLSVIPKDNLGKTDVLEVMRNEGQRSVIVHILSKVGRDIDKEVQTETIHETI